MHIGENPARRGQVDAPRDRPETCSGRGIPSEGDDRCFPALDSGVYLIRFTGGG